MANKEPEVEQQPLNIHQAMCSILKDIGPISKDKINTEQKYKFRGIDAAMDALNPLMAKYGVFPVISEIETIVWESVVSSNGKKGFHGVKKYTFTFTAMDGSHVSTTTEGEAIDYGDKCVTKCQSVAYREALYKTFVAPFEASIVDPQGSVDIEDQDHDIQAPRPKQKTQQQPAQPATTQKPITQFGIKRNKDIWENYWTIMVGVKSHERDAAGVPLHTMEHMWTSFAQTLEKLYGKKKIEELTMKQSMQLEKLLQTKLDEIIEQEQAMVIQQKEGTSQTVHKVVHNRATAGKTQSKTSASAYQQ